MEKCTTFIYAKNIITPGILLSFSSILPSIIFSVICAFACGDKGCKTEKEKSDAQFQGNSIISGTVCYLLILIVFYFYSSDICDISPILAWMIMIILLLLFLSPYIYYTIIMKMSRDEVLKDEKRFDEYKKNHEGLTDQQINAGYKKLYYD
jgi:hypothetical protein